MLRVRVTPTGEQVLQVSLIIPHFWNLHHIQTKCINSVLVFPTSWRCEPHGTYRSPGTVFTFSLQEFAEEEPRITTLVIFTSRGDNTQFSPLPALRHHSCSSHPAPPGPAAASVEPTPPLQGASPPPSPRRRTRPCRAEPLSSRCAASCPPSVRTALPGSGRMQ